MGLENLKGMRSISSKLVFVIFVTIFLSCFLFLVKKMSLDTLDVIIYPAILMSFVITWPVAVINMIRYCKKEQAAKKSYMHNRFKNLPFKSLICFLASIPFVLILNYGFKSAVRVKVKTFLNEVSPAVIVRINGEPTKIPNRVIAELKKVALLSAHYSSPTKRVHIEVVNRDETLRLVLGRDTNNYQEYWVFYPEYRYTSRNEIGRIVTNLFDDY